MFQPVLELMSLSCSFVAQFNFLELGLFFHQKEVCFFIYLPISDTKKQTTIIQGSYIYFHPYNSAKTAH